MSNGMEHLDREWEAMGWSKDDEDDPQSWIYHHLKELLELFTSEGHSGTSAPYVVELFSKLALFKPLGPLSGKDSEWIEVGENTFQNKRCSHVFKENGQAYDIQGRIFRHANGTAFQSYDSRVDVTFPYEPTTEFVDVPDAEPESE